MLCIYQADSLLREGDRDRDRERQRETETETERDLYIETNTLPPPPQHSSPNALLDPTLLVAAANATTLHDAPKRWNKTADEATAKLS
jgi:hypothetical protein